MADKIDYDSMSDEDFMALVEEQANAPQEDVDETENFEDTDHTESEEEEQESETETNQSDDGQVEETEDDPEESSEDEDEENAQVDDDSESEEGESAGTESEDGTETDDEETDDEESEEDDSEEDEEAGSEEEADEIDYKKQYEELMEKNTRLQSFYDEVTSEFVANGKKMKGFDDPKKIIQAQQMAAGFAEKMSNFKQYRPFMNALKEKGLLDNPDKFNLAMNLLDGDPEALKQQLKTMEIDPFEMDMDNINYKPKNQVSTNIEIAFDDVMESAKNNNVEAEVRQIITNDWDDNSVIALLEDPQSSSDLIEHISTGAYKVVQDRIADKKRSDVNGVFSSKSSIEQYREAAIELENEYNEYVRSQGEQNNAGSDAQAEAQANAQEDATKQYKAKVEKRNAKAKEGRKRAASVSKKKTVSKPVKKTVTVDDMSDDEITAYLDNLIYAQ